MAKKKAPSMDVGQSLQQIQRQFSNLDSRDPSSWPPVPRYALCLFIALVVVVVAWFAKLTDYETELQAEQAKEVTLRQDYQQKMTKAVNLEALKKQREQIQLYVIQLEKQLPSKAEMAALLSDINQAGLGRSLQFDLFKPGQVIVKDYYAELPIAVRVTGKFHDMGAFASDIAHLSRIVTLNDLSIAPPTDKGASGLVLNATARTFRYLDPEEIQAQKKATAAAAGGQK